ncbi:MAG: adenylosuccinate lyase [Candidatus Aenigmarchaeota archaeon]|nr:adenylosuccinate lyase [Candidatus Aenigmarchaeota archaeon]
MTFSGISPFDYRYLRDKKLAEKVAPFLSEEARIGYQLKVECAVAKGLARVGACTRGVADEIIAAAAEVTAKEVYEEEDRIQHDIRALVNCIRKRLGGEAKPFVHLGVTSSDIINTADAMRYREFTGSSLLPSLLELERTLIRIARTEKATLQIGRTHGQHAEPITFGFALTEYVSRLGGRILALAESAGNLRGKMSGAVGAYNALALITDNAETFEAYVLDELGLKPATHATQIVEPEYLLDYVHCVVAAFGVIANLADDMRHLQRTELAEIGESFGDEQVGSSTMPHKRNPVNFENVKSMWKAMMPRMITLYADQISEHQRDLTNSASGRFVPELLAGLLVAAERMQRTMQKLAVDREQMRRNVERSKSRIITEPLYVLLAVYGCPDAHEAVRRLTLLEKPILEALEQDAALVPYYAKFTPQQKEILEHPETYTGRAAEKTEAVCSYWETMLSQ